MSKKKRILPAFLSALLSLIILCGGIGTASYTAGAESVSSKNGNAAVTAEKAEEKSDSGKSEEKNLFKTETVYVIAGADGEPEKVIVSDWIKNSAGADKIKDVSDLKDIENVKGDETYSINEDKLMEWNADGNDIYYQGTGKSELPVGLKLKYTLDGKAISAEELEGKSGKLKIRIDYTNRQYEKVKINGKEEKIYVPFVMLSGMMLSNDNCANVEVTNGKVVNDGSHTYVVGFALPGMQESLDLDKDKLELPSYVEITMDAKDFEPVTTLTVAANDMFSDVDFSKADDALDELDEKLEKLTDAAGKLVDGSSQLYDGIKTLLDKSSTLVDGVNQLYDGAKQLDSGAGSLGDGAAALESGAKQLDSGLAALSGGAATLDGGAKKLKDGAESLNSGAKQLYNGADSLDSGMDTLSGGVNTLDSGAGNLSSGAYSLDSGVAQLQGYIGTLSGGLESISANSSALNAGAKQVFETLLATADAQIAAAGLTADKLTIENYASVLDALVASLSEENIEAMAYAKALETVTAAVNSQRDIIRTAVEAEVRKQVTEAVLSSAGYNMTAEEYEQAVAAGLIPEEAQAQIAAAVAAQMSSDAVQAAIDSNTEAQIQSLIEQNMQSEEVQAQIAEAVAKAKAGREALSALKTQLDSYNSFYTGVLAYTAGVDQANEGAKQILGGAYTLKSGSGSLAQGAAELKGGADNLAEGTVALKSGTSQLKDGASQLKDGTESLKSGAGELKNGTQSLNEGISKLKGGSSKLASGAGELRVGAETLKKGTGQLYGGVASLKDGMPALVDGVTALKDGALQLSDGMKQFKKEGVDAVVEAFDDKAETLVERLKAISKVSSGYRSYSGLADGMDGKADFIFKTSTTSKDNGEDK